MVGSGAILWAAVSWAEPRSELHFLHVDVGGKTPPLARIMDYIEQQFPEYRLIRLEAPMRRSLNILQQPPKDGVYCSFSNLSTHHHDYVASIRWSNIISLNPDAWAIVFNKRKAQQMTKYQTREGYFDESLSQVNFATDDLPYSFLGVFRDPQLKAGYAYWLPPTTPQDIVAKTTQLTSAESGDQILRMVDMGRLDVTGMSTSILFHATQLRQFKNLAVLRYKNLTNSYAHPLKQFGLLCSRNASSNQFLDKFNALLQEVRGEPEFVRMLLDDYFPEYAIVDTLRFSDKLKAGDYDLAKADYSAQCRLDQRQIDQTQGGNQWQLLATVTDPVAVSLSAAGEGYTAADAVKFDRLDAQGQVLSSHIYSHRDAAFEQRGFGSRSLGKGSYVADYSHNARPYASPGRVALWIPKDLPQGEYKVSLHWPHYDLSRPAPTNVPITIASGQQCKTAIVPLN